MMEHQEEDEEKESFLPLDVVVVDRQEPRPRRAMSSRLSQLRGLKRVPFLKLEFWSNPKVLGGVSLALVVILFVYLPAVLPNYTSPQGGGFAEGKLYLPPVEPLAHQTLITYVYSESFESQQNLLFFISHGLHAKADFVFIFNGDSNHTELIPKGPNIEIVVRSNTCYDLGAHGEVLTMGDRWLKYKKFILMNASVRGPFMPHWAEACWSDRLLSKVTEKVKLVGLSLNCWPVPHVQSMVWATDRMGMSLLLQPPASSPRHDGWMDVLFSHPAQFPRPADRISNDPNWREVGINKCFENRQQAVEAEIAATQIMFGAAKRVDVMLMKFQTDPDYNAHCSRLGAWDPYSANGAYDGINIHPFEGMFIKTNRGIDPRALALHTGWVDRSGMTSYDYC